MSSWTAEPHRATARLGRPGVDPGTDGLRGRLAHLLARFHAERERRRLYAQTVRELAQLSDRELDDIGISRCDIRAIAAEHTRERLGR